MSRSHDKKLVANQMKEIEVATLRIWTPSNVSHCENWIPKNFCISENLRAYLKELIWHSVKESRCK